MKCRAIVLPAVLIGAVVPGVGGGTSEYLQSAESEVTLFPEIPRRTTASRSQLR